MIDDADIPKGTPLSDRELDGLVGDLVDSAMPKLPSAAENASMIGRVMEIIEHTPQLPGSADAAETVGHHPERG